MIRKLRSEKFTTALLNERLQRSVQCIVVLLDKLILRSENSIIKLMPRHVYKIVKNESSERIMVVLLRALSVILHYTKSFAVVFSLLNENTLFYRLIADTTGIMANYEALVVS